MIVLDASVLIAYLDRDDQHHLQAETLLAREIDDDFAANSWTRLRCLSFRHAKADCRPYAARWQTRSCTSCPSPTDTAVELTQLRAGTNLKMPDCWSLLAAQNAHARLTSFDDRLVAAAAALNLDTIRK